MVLSTARDVPLAFTQMGDGEKEKQKINIMSQTIPSYTIWDTRIILWQNLGMKVTVKNVEEQALCCLFSLIIMKCFYIGLFVTGKYRYYLLSPESIYLTLSCKPKDNTTVYQKGQK